LSSPFLHSAAADPRCRRPRTPVDSARDLPIATYQLVVAPDGRAWYPFLSLTGRAMWELPAGTAELDAYVLLDRVHRDDQGRLIAAFRESGLRRAAVVARFRVVLPSGRERTYLTQALPERMEDGGLCWSGCTVDVTGPCDGSAAAAGLQHRPAGSRCSATAREAFSSFIAQDLRPAVHRIGAFARALVAAGDHYDSTRVASISSRIAANAAGVEQLLDALLALARAMEGELQ
jgi:signal transduction histidine kinase